MPPTEPRRGAGSTRAVPRLLLVAALVLLAARLAAIAWDVRHEPPPPPDRVTWVPLEQAEAVARAEGKPLLYEFGAEWCGPCRVLESEVFGDSAAARLIERQFVPVRVVDRRREEGSNPPLVDSLQRAFGVEAFPTLVAAWPGGGPSMKMRGYRGHALTVTWLATSARGVRRRAAAGADSLPR